MNTIFNDLSFERYIKETGVSASTLQGYARSAAHGRYYETHPTPPTRSQKLGTMLHTMLLEPEKFNSQYVFLEDSPCRGSEAWKDYERLNPGKTLIKAVEAGEEQAVLLSAIKSKWDENKEVQKLIKGAAMEISCFWTDHEYQQQCKSRPDVWNKELTVLCDLKTTINASYGAFRKQVEDLGYYRKAAWYMDGMAALGHKVDLFVFIAVETEMPTAVCCYPVEASLLELGRKEMRDLLKLYHTCKVINEWPSYPSMSDLGASPWLTKRSEEKYGKGTGEATQ